VPVKGSVKSNAKLAPLIHHATERLGMQALCEHLSACYGLEHRFFIQDNPV